MSTRDITVVGAGIVGVSVGLYLLRDGHRVTLLDRDGPGMGCSFGNAGMLEGNAVVPVATPGLLRQVPGLLLDPLGPLAVKWRHLPRLLPWLVRFLWQSGEKRARANARALAPLVLNAFDAYRPLIDAAGAGDLVSDTGWLWTFESEAELAGLAWDQAVRRDLGIHVQRLEGEPLFEKAPALSRDVPVGLYFPTTRACSDPYGFVQRLAAAFEREGGRLLTRELRDLRPGTPHRLVTDAGEMQSEVLVLATGAWSARFCRQLGESVPLNTERGYHCMLPDPGVHLPVPIMFHEHKFVAHSMKEGLRLAGTIELGGLHHPPDWRRADVLLQHARKLLPGLHEEGFTRWMGLRPTLPDSLPVIGPSNRHPSVYHAFGHQHLGLTLGGLTGRLIADLVAGREPPFELSPYRVNRF